MSAERRVRPFLRRATTAVAAPSPCVDRGAVAPALRQAIVDLAIIDHGVGEPDADAYDRGDHLGTYWGIRSDAMKFPAVRNAHPDPLGRAGRNPDSLAAIPTRLKAMDVATQEKLINWGYAICDAALMSHWGPLLQQRYGAITPTTTFPFPRGY